MQSLEAKPRLRFVRLVTWVAALVAGVAGQFWLVVDYQPASAAAAWAVAAAAFVVLYFAAAQSRALPGAATAEMSPRAEWMWLAVVLGLGVFFVCFRIGEFPPGLNHDAAWEGLYALRILEGEPFTPYTSEAWGRETMTFYFRAAAAWLLGPTVLAVQAPAMIAGVLTLPFFYGWLRLLFGARVALAATALLAVSGWHLVFSRTGWRSDFQPLFMAATCYWFFRGLQRPRPVDFLLGGLSLALALNTYNGSRVFPAVFALWLPLVVLQSWRLRSFLRRYGMGLAFFALAFAIAIAPLALYAVNHWDVFMGRAAALRGASTFGDALRATALLFNLRGNGDDFFVSEPALELPAAVFFVFGLLWAVLRVRDERAQFLLIALLINLVPGLVSKPNLNRNVGTMIFVYAFAGMGVVFFARQLRVLLPRIGNAAAVAFVLVAAAAATTASYREFLSDDRRPVWGYYPETTVLGRAMRELVPGFDIWVGGANFPRDSLTYLSYQGQGDPMRRNYVWLDDVGDLLRNPPAPRAGKGLAFLLANEGDGIAVFDTLARRFPAHEVVEFRYPADTGRVFARGLLVSAGAAGAPAAVAPAAEPAIAGSATPVAPGTLAEPRGVAIAGDGSVAVADFGHHRIQVFDADLRFVRQWGGEGGEPGEFRQPSDVAIAADGRLYVADTWNGRVQMFSLGGEFLGQSEVALYGPRALTVAPDGRVVVADTGNARVVVFDANLGFVRAFGEKGSGAGQLAEPIGVAVAADGRTWVADNANGRLAVFDRDGKAEQEIAVPGWTSAVFSEPRLAFDATGRLWATVPRAAEIRVYDSAGKVVATIAAEALRDRFDMPMGLAAGPDGVVVAGLNGTLGRLEPTAAQQTGSD
jgi:DNA-binding beta-propeller fold protein YncE